MLNFPVPYDTETIYSVIARAGMNLAVLSPKQLLDDVFQDRKVVATMDLPCNINKIAFHLQATGKFSALELIYQHTLFPLYAFFVPEYTRLKAIELMCESSGGAVHMMLGVAASNVKADDHFKYCPSCVQNHYKRYGEVYWKREWFLPALKVCSEHGALSVLTNRIKESRHSFKSASLLLNSSLSEPLQKTEMCHLKLQQQLSAKASELLVLPPMPSPTTRQWSAFYKNIAIESGFVRGKFVCHRSILERFISIIPQAALEALGLYESLENDTGWLKSMFRKHRKSFSYLHHLLIWQVFLPELSVEEIIKRVSCIAFKKETKNNVSECVDKVSGECLEKRRQWELLIDQLGIKSARCSSGGGALYAWLYRHDRIHFLAVNAEYKKKESGPRSEKVSWKKRDFSQTKQLFRLLKESEYHTPNQRMSCNWFLKQLGRDSMVYSRKEKMPLTWKFLANYSESVSEYQLRRVASYCAEQVLKGSDIRLWRLLRGAGLSEGRMTFEARSVLIGLGYIDSP